MAAIPLNLTLEQGTDFSVNLTVRNSDGSPLNLLGYTASSEVRKHYTSTTKYPFDVTFADRSLGKISLTMTDTATALINEGRYVYDVYITSGNGNKSRVIAGMLFVSPGVRI